MRRLPAPLVMGLAALLGPGALPGVPPAAATEGPETALVAGPPHQGFTTSRTAALAWTSPDDATAWECTLDLAELDCAGESIELTGLRAGTHAFTVAAVDAEGVADSSPARRTWTVPRNDRQLDADRRWRRGRDRSAYRGTFRLASRRGATLTTRGTDVRSLALVATTGPRAGRVVVFLGPDRLGRFDLRTPRRRYRRLVHVASFAGVRSGQVRVVVRSRGRPVTIEGLGVATWFVVPDA